jgi:chaperone modulatory protein CbpM
MNNLSLAPKNEQIVEEEVHLTLMELCHACHTSEDHVISWVYEGVLKPVGETPKNWRFSGPSMRRARLASSLSYDLEINLPGIALALDLLDEIHILQTRLKRVSAR